MAGLASQLEPGQGPQAGLRGVLGVWATGRMSNPTEMGRGWLSEKAGHGGFGHAGLGELRGHLLGPGLAVGQLAARGAVQTSVQKAVRAWP